MKKKVIKRILCIASVFLMVSYSFATSVSDNTGSSFITKAEFDSLKNNFQSQLDEYNSGIDTKIDEAIASYLQDISISGILPLGLDGKCLYTFPITMHNDDSWNTRTSVYYSVSSPLIHDLKYVYGDTSVSRAGTCNLYYPDHSRIESYSVKKFSYTGAEFGLATFSRRDFNLTGIPGFLFSVGNINGTRAIPNSAGGALTTYNTRPRLDCGIGNDNVVFLGYTMGGGIGTSSSRESIDNGNTSTTKPPAYCYTNMLGFGVSTGGTGGNPGASKVTVTVANPKTWTKTTLPSGSGTGYGISGGVRIPIADFGRTYSSYIAKINAWGCWTGGWVGGTSNITYNYSTNPPITEQFNWQTSNQQTRVYTGFTNVPAEKTGDWALTPDTKSLAISSQFREVMLVDGSAIYGTSWNAGTTKHYYGPGLSFYYYVVPYWAAAANSSVMPPDGTSFSQLPASLVYYFDSNGDKHFLDEGMFLQTFTENGTATIDLKFGTRTTSPKVDIIFSKKPFDRTWVASDALPVKVGTSTYTTYTLDTAGTKDVSFTIENIKKNDKLYLKWSPQTASDYVELADIPKFELAYKK